MHFRHHAHRGSTQIIFRDALCNLNLLKHAGSSQGYTEGLHRTQRDYTEHLSLTSIYIQHLRATLKDLGI